MTAADENGPERRDDDLVAAEYVLGVLPAEERTAAAARIDREPAFAALVEAWESRLAPMAESYEPAAVPDSIKQAIDARLFAAEERPTRAGLWSSLALWRGIAAAALIALGAYAALTWDRLPFFERPATETQRLVASLAHDDTDVRYLVVYDGAARAVSLSHVTGARPGGRDFELWAIEGDEDPVSLGVIPDGASVRLGLNAALDRIVSAGDTFAITTEPQGGSPSGAPTGPVVALGNLRPI